jgi:hypothetical protein
LVVLLSAAISRDAEEINTQETNAETVFGNINPSLLAGFSPATELDQ